MDVITVLVVVILINKSYSQTISFYPTCFSSGKKLTLNCDTPTVNQGITFFQDGINKGGCVPSIPVSCGIGLTQSGTTTSLEISSFNDATNSGNWTCEYGASASPVVIIAVTPCTSTSDGLKPGHIGGIAAACVVIVFCLIAVTVLVSYRKGLFCFATSRQTTAIEKEVSARAGSDVKLLPDLKSIAHVESVTWIRAGKTVKTENELMHQDGTIPCVSPKDSGLWYCNLIFENGNEKNFVIRLNVIIYQYEADKGTRVQLLDYINKSQSFQDVQWYHGKLKISGNELKYQGGTKEVPSLYVGRLEEEDAGEYTCEILFQNAVKEIPVKLAVKSQSNSSLPPLRTSGLTTSTS